MRGIRFSLLLCMASLPVMALDLSVAGVEQGKPMPERFAYCAPEGKDGENQRPALRWSGVPAEAKSLAVLVVDPDVPTDFADAGKPDKTLPAAMPRQDFIHWAAFDLPITSRGLAPSSGRGADKTPLASGQESLNDYARFMQPADPTVFRGYDGPCPPANDERLHHYHFQLHALDTATLDLPKDAPATEAAAAIRKHSLGMAEVVGTYTLKR